MFRSYEKSEYSRLFDEYNQHVADSPFKIRIFAYGFPLDLSSQAYVTDPEISHSGGIVINHLPNDLRGKYVLDMGCGSGLISLAAAYRGANVVACDYDTVSLDLAVENINKLNSGVASQISIYHSDLFSAFERANEKPPFDLIAANLWFPIKHRPAYAHALSVYEEFFMSCRDYLSPNGKVMLTSSEFADTMTIRGLMERHKITPAVYQERRKHFDEKLDVNWYLYMFDHQGKPAVPEGKLIL
jgi:methylase of polypeptide subunit release factors